MDHPRIGDKVRYDRTPRQDSPDVWTRRREADSLVVDGPDNGVGDYRLYTPGDAFGDFWFAPASGLRVVARANYEPVSAEVSS